MDKTDEPPKPLLDDEELVALLSAEHAAEGSPVDALAKRRIERKLRARGVLGSPREEQRHRRRMGLAAAALVFLVAGPFVARLGKPPAADDGRPKGADSAEALIPVTLTAQVLDADGAATPLAGAAKAGTKLLFQAKLARQGTVILLAKRGDEPPRMAASTVVKDTEAPVTIEAGAGFYAYEVEDRDHTRFCAVGIAPLAKEHNAQPFDALAMMASLPSSACLTLNVGEPRPEPTP